MKERPIIFNGPMVRAILEGRKTQTRRPVKWPDWVDDIERAAFNLHQYPMIALYHDGHPRKLFGCPFGVPGDRLWVREPFCEDYYSKEIHYKADGWESPGPKGFWRPSTRMPRWASRITLEITGVRVERVQDIGISDACAEGMKSKQPYSGGPTYYVQSFMELWDSLYAKRGLGWDINPWVWVVEFRKATGGPKEE